MEIRKIPREKGPWNPTLAYRTRKDGAPNGYLGIKVDHPDDERWPPASISLTVTNSYPWSRTR